MTTQQPPTTTRQLPNWALKALGIITLLIISFGSEYALSNIIIWAVALTIIAIGVVIAYKTKIVWLGMGAAAVLALASYWLNDIGLIPLILDFADALNLAAILLARVMLFTLVGWQLYKTIKEALGGNIK